MDWARRACTLLLVPSFVVLGTLVFAAAQAAVVEMPLTGISDKITVKYPASWTAPPATYPTARELVVKRKARHRAPADAAERDVELIDARMLITSEARKNHAEAVMRLLEIATERRGAVKFLAIGGWPAVEVTFVDRLAIRGSSHAPAQFGHRAIIAIAAEGRIVRFDVSLLPGASLQLLQEAQAIAQSTTFPTHDTPAGVRRNLQELDRKLIDKRLQSSAAARKTTTKVLAVGAPIIGPKSGPPAAVHPGFGELEVAMSPDAMNVVIASQFQVAFSTDRAATFTAGDHGLFLPRDPTVARGASGDFYLGTLANPNGTATHKNVKGCTAAVSRSSDGGATFALQGYAAQCPETRSSPGEKLCSPDQPHVAGEPAVTTGPADQLYVVWRKLIETGTESQCKEVIITPHREPMMSCSTDGGVTWRAEASIPGAGDFPRVAVARDGTVFVASLSGDSKVYLHRFSSCASGLTAVLGPVTVATLTADVACPMPGLDRCNFGNTMSSPTVAIDPDDAAHVFVAFAEGDGAGGERVVVAESRDSGATFSSSTTVSGTVSARRYFPWSCSIAGNAWVGWYDRRAALPLGARNDLTDYYIGVARSSGGSTPSLTAGAERQITTSSDAQCSTWSLSSPLGNFTCSPRNTDDSEKCSDQPQKAGVCLAPSGPSSRKRCDFTDGDCTAPESCQTEGGCPKYGDYNGMACAPNWVIAAWASATPPAGLPPASGLGIYASAQYVGDYPLEYCKTHPKACVDPTGFSKGILRVNCKQVPCIIVDPVPKNCLAKWTCPGCPPGVRCRPFYHIVFDETLQPWKVDIVDAQGRQVRHDRRRVGRNIIMTVRPSEAEHRAGEIADYRLVFRADKGVTPGKEYTIRADLETSDSPVPKIARTPR